MIFEKSNINETKQIDNVIITLDGVQYTEIIPTAYNEERLHNFGNSGVVAITLRLLIDNQSSEKVNIDQIGSFIFLPYLIPKVFHHLLDDLNA